MTIFYLKNYKNTKYNFFKNNYYFKKINKLIKKIRERLLFKLKLKINVN
jgi:hypothetical protein